MECNGDHSIDQCYFQGIPAYTWYSAAEYDPDKLRTIPQRDLYSLIKTNIRSGVSQRTRRYGKVTESDQFILYTDVNALYSHVTTIKLPMNLNFFTSCQKTGLVNSLCFGLNHQKRCHF